MCPIYRFEVVGVSVLSSLAFAAAGAGGRNLEAASLQLQLLLLLAVAAAAVAVVINILVGGVGSCVRGSTSSLAALAATRGTDPHRVVSLLKVVIFH